MGCCGGGGGGGDDGGGALLCVCPFDGGVTERKKGGQTASKEANCN